MRIRFIRVVGFVLCIAVAITLLRAIVPQLEAQTTPTASKVSAAEPAGSTANARANAQPSHADRTRAATNGGFAIALAPYTYRFPFDAGAHPAYQTEWWYYTGHVAAADGHRYGYELTFFRFGLRPREIVPSPGQSRWRGDELYPAHFALTDIDGQRFDHVERFARSALGMGKAAIGTLDTSVDDWYVRGVEQPNVTAERETMRMHASAEMNGRTVALDFDQVPEKPPAIHGSEGVSRKAGCPSCASHYYSYTRLRTTGALTIAGMRVPVTGISWMDHEFGSAQLESNQSGWDWFSIQLDDDRELMLYDLRQKDGSVTPESSGSIIDAAGHVQHVELSDFTATATGSWKSPHTGATYPSGWHVRVPKANVDLTLTPVLADQELDSAIGGTYWEGAVDVRDAAGKPAGQGYVELTGYAGGISL
jgi:predicted secreted hydrolase